MGDAQARLVHHVRVEEAQHAHELILSMRGAAHADARAGQRDGLLRQHLRFGGAYGARQPVQEVLQRSGDRVVVLGAEQPQAVCFANGLAHAHHRFGGGMLDILVHERHVFPAENAVSDLRVLLAHQGSGRFGQLPVIAVLAQGSCDCQQLHDVSFRSAKAPSCAGLPRL